MRFAPEDQLLVECARTHLDDAARRRVAALVRGGLDWDYVVETSVRHAVAPLVSGALREVEASEELDGDIPSSAHAELADLYRRSESRSGAMLRAVGEIADAFTAESIDVIALKDVQLAAGVYPEPALRPLGDIDLLVRREELERAARLLPKLGFLPQPGADMPYTTRYASGRAFLRERDQAWVDLQWTVAQREWDLHGDATFAYRIDRMWASAERFTLDGHELLAPCPDEMLFHLCLHLEGHEYSELVLFSDLVELLRHHAASLDWLRFAETVRLHGAEASVGYALLLTQRLFGAELPRGLLRDLEGPYFQADLFGPVFGNLTSLHLSLDQIRLAASPPQELLDELEVVVRRQAARARRLFAELDAVARGFRASGGRVIAFTGRSPQRVFPDASVPAFDDVHALVLDEDARHVGGALRASGFAVTDGSVRGSKRCTVASSDPVLARDRAGLSIHVDVAREAGALVGGDDTLPYSNRRAALRSLAARLRAGAGADRDPAVRLVVHALPAAELAASLLARAGRRESGRLFRLGAVFEFLRRYQAPLDSGKVMDVARRTASEEAVAAGAQAVAALAGPEEGRVLQGLGAGARAPVKLLEFARYDAASLERSPAFRDAYFFVFSLLALRGLGARTRFLVRSLVLPDRGLPVVPRIAIQIATHVLTARAKPRPSLRDLSYWARPPRERPVEQAPERNEVAGVA